MIAQPIKSDEIRSAVSDLVREGLLEVERPEWPNCPLTWQEVLRTPVDAVLIMRSLRRVE